MGNTDTLPSAGSDPTDEALLAGEESPPTLEAPPAEPGAVTPPETPPEPKVPEEGKEGIGEETPPDGEPKAAKPDGEEGEAPEDGTYTDRQVPEEIKNLFKMEEVGPKIRDLYFRDAAYREHFSTVAEAREVKELLPNGVESAKELMGIAERLEPFEAAFTKSGQGPEGATEFWQAIHAEDPAAYNNLHGAAVENILHHFDEQATKTGDENLKASVDVLWRRMKGGEAYEGRKPTTETSLKERNLQEREQAVEDKETQGFKTAAFAETEQQVEGNIRKHVHAVLANSNVPKGAMSRIVDDIHAVIINKIQENPTLKFQLNRAFRRGDLGPEHHKSIVSLVVNRATSLIPELSRDIIKDWTHNYLALNKDTLKRLETSRADVGPGGPPGQPSGVMPKPAQVDYSKASDTDLLTAPNIPLKQ